MKTAAFFNTDGGVGKTTLVYHVAHMLAELGTRVLILDLDPQSNITAMCLAEERLEELWTDSPDHPHTVLGCLRPSAGGTAEIGEPHIELLSDRLGLVAGDLGLSSFEDEFADAWRSALDHDEAALTRMSAFHRIAQRAAEAHRAEVVLLDMAPNLGAINRAALLATRHLITPLAPDLFSVQGLRSLGPTVSLWRRGWAERLDRMPPSLDSAKGVMNPLGYVLMQAETRLSRPDRSYERWAKRLPGEYHRSLIGDASSEGPPSSDPRRLGIMRDHPSLLPLARDARKPMFALKPADGAIGAHVAAVVRCREEFAELAKQMLARMDEADAVATA